MTEVTRYDQLNLDELKLKETPEGYLEGFAIATRVGVFSYQRADGSVQREYRPAEEVFNEDSMNSFKMVPITDNHPSVMVTAENAKELSVGFTGQEIKRIDGKFMAPYVKITEKKAVDAAKQGLKKGLSWGYKVNLVKQDGIFNGERYDYVQKNIRGNHLAIVNQGRAGDQARLRLDAEDAICVFNNNFKENLNMKKIRLDGKEFEVSEEVASRLDSLETDNSSLKDTNRGLTAKADTLEGERDGLKVKLEAELKKDHSAEIAEKVKARIALISKAAEFLKKDEDISGLSDRDVQIKAVTAVLPESKFDGKSDEYVAARFDSICEFKKDAKLAEHFKVASNKTDGVEDKTDEAAALSSKSLQANLIKRSTNKTGE